MNKRKPNGFYSKMSDVELLDYYRACHNETSRSKLHKVNRGLHNALDNRGLLSEIDPLYVGRGKLSDWNYIELRLKALIKRNNGKFPKQKQFADFNETSLQNAIKRYHQGISAVREKMGYAFLKNPDGHLKKWDNFEKEMKKAIKENHGTFPTIDWLTKKGYSRISNSVLDHGGINTIREKMGYPLTRANKDTWTDLENVLIKLKEIGKKYQVKCPSYSQIVKEGYAGMYLAIRSRHGGMKKLYELLGGEPKIRPNGFWSIEENVFEEAEKAMKEQGWTEFPGSSVVSSAGYSSLASAISSKHGGFQIFRKKLYNKLGLKREEESERLKSLLEKYADGGGKDA
jgi:hypothetical protein